MKTDGLEVSTVVLNSLINAFGEDRRIAEAFSVLQFMKENVSSYLCFLVSTRFVYS
jgi:pentatricopeptide repeat protein